MDEYEMDVLMQEQKAMRRYRQKLISAPDCRDPDHPGCEFCEDDEDD